MWDIVTPTLKNVNRDSNMENGVERVGDLQTQNAFNPYKWGIIRNLELWKLPDDL
jgi:hypothetical protein